MKLKIHSCIIIFMFAYLSVFGQTARIYTSGSGLPNSRINNIFQDSDGFVWISTENGLARFDGMDFATFRYDKNASNSIASDLVVTMYEDSHGTYWVGTSAGLQTFSAEYNTFSKIDLHDKSVPSSNQHIADILQVEYLGKDKILAASSGHGIYIISPDDHKVDSLLQNSLNQILPSQFINRMFADSRGRLWVGAEDGGICVIELSSGMDVTPPSHGIGSDIIITSFDEDIKTGNIILGSSGQGILIYDNQTDTIRKSRDLSATTCRVESLLKNNIAGQYGESTFLVGIENNGIKLYDTVSEALTDIDFPNVPFRTASWKVHSLMEDNQGNVWAGAFQTGVLVIPKSMYGFEYVSLKNNGDIGNESCVTSVIEDRRNGDILVGTDGGGLYRVSRDGRRTRYSTEDSSLTNNSIMSLVQDKRGTIWIATYLGGLFSWSERGGFRQFSDNSALNTNKTVSLAYSPDSDILYVGTHGNGLSIISPARSKVLRTFSEDDNKWISSLYIDKTGMLWVGTYNGVMCYDHRIKNLIGYEIDETLKTRVNSFCESTDGKIWIGTGEGLVSFDRTTKETMTFTEKDGLPTNVVNDIREGNDGNLWIATLNGLSRFNTSTKEFKNYYQYDGLQENEFHAKASFAAADGKLYFGGIKGLTAFYPHLVDQKKHPVPPLYFSDLRVMNEPVQYEREADSDNILDKHITQATMITIPNDRNMFSMMFSVLEYTNPRKITYDYMIEGFDNDWNHTRPDSRTITYTNLPSGKYTLKVKAYFEGNPDEFSYREMGIRILPPWYRTIWACILYMVLAIMGILAFIGWRRRNAVRKREMEESEIKEMKLQMFTNISHEIRTPLTLVMNPLKKMREAETDAKQKELYNLMYRNSLRILRLVNQLLDMRKIDSGQLQLHFLETDVVYFIRDIMKSFDNLAVSKNIKFTITPSEEITNLWIDQGNFDKIIFNILSNAFKYTPDNGSIAIHISGRKENDGVLEAPVKEFIEFTVENSGSSIDERYIDRIFERFFQADVRDAKVGSGVGLNLTKKLVELHHGDISAHNTDNGMAFSIRIPAGHSHLSREEMTKPTNHKDLYTKNPVMIDEHFESREDVTYAPSKDEKDGRKQLKSKKNIVLVDDDSEMRAYLRLELQAYYNVETCASGKEAWAKITTTNPDAVVTDLIMEGMDGAELCEKVKKNPETNLIPVIILTSSSDENSQQRCIDSGADRFLTKPISLEILKSTIANTISTRDTIRNKYREIDYRFNDIKMSDSDNKLLTKVIDVIRQNIENTEFSVEDLSREVGMSRVHLNRRLKEIMNISPSNLIKSIRLKQAAFLLINNKVNISEVAYRVGFSTHSYFSNSFHDYFGMTPKEFVARYLNCEDEETLKRIFE